MSPLRRRFSRLSCSRGALLAAPARTGAGEPGFGDLSLDLRRGPYGAPAGGARRGGSRATSASARASGEADLSRRRRARLKTEPAQTVSSFEPGEFTLNFENADIREVVQSILGNTLGENYVDRSERRRLGDGFVRASARARRPSPGARGHPADERRGAGSRRADSIASRWRRSGVGGHAPMSARRAPATASRSCRSVTSRRRR